jgi:hypothetical protein
MCNVSKEEANESRKRLLAWANSAKIPSSGSLGQWIYHRSEMNSYVQEVPSYTKSLTENARQENWKTPSEFPLCPANRVENTMEDYYSNLKIGEIFSKNEYSKSIIEEFAISEDKRNIWIKCINSDESIVKPWTLAQVSMEEDIFIHKNLGSFMHEDGAMKQFTLVQGEKMDWWNHI